MRILPYILALAGLLAVPASAQRPEAVQRPAGYPRSYDTTIARARTEGRVRIYANADRAELVPVVAAFKRAYPGIKVFYADLGSTEMYARFVRETRTRQYSADIVWSSAMDQQIKLINDGYAQQYASPEKPYLPETAVWKNMGFGVTAEPIGIVYNRKLVPASQVPRSVHGQSGHVRSGAFEHRLPVSFAGFPGHPRHPQPDRSDRRHPPGAGDEDRADAGRRRFGQAGDRL